MKDPPDDRRRSGRAWLLQTLVSTAIAVALLLPLFVLNQQRTNLAIERLELELAQAKSAARVPEPASASPEPRTEARSNVETAVRPIAPVRPAPLPPSPPPALTREPSGEIAQIARSIDELTKKVDQLATPNDSPGARRTEIASEPPASESPAPPPPSPQTVVDMKIRVEYSSRCVKTAFAVAQQLINLGAVPELVEQSQRGLRTARAIYTREELLGVATQTADALSAITPVEVVLEPKGRFPDVIQLQLAATAGCGRPLGP